MGTVAYTLITETRHTNIKVPRGKGHLQLCCSLRQKQRKGGQFSQLGDRVEEDFQSRSY